MTDRLRVSTDDGKYTVIQRESGGMRFLRHGEEWPAADEHFQHVGMILALAQELARYKNTMAVRTDPNQVTVEMITYARNNGSTDTTRKIDTLRRWSKKEASGMNMPYLADIADEMERIYALMIRRYDEMPWRPINELFDKDGKYDHENDDPNGFLLMAPELVDEDCNVHGVGMGYWQDDGLTWHATQEECDAWPDDRACGAFMACKWSMTNDEWAHVCCAPTHYLRLRGAETCK